jgi:hypothetical protein
MIIPSNPNKEEKNKRIALSLKRVIETIEEIPNITRNAIDKNPEK